MMGVSVQTMPGPSLEVIKPELFLELLMGLLANPARRDGAGEHLDRRAGWQVREVVVALATGATFPRRQLTVRQDAPASMASAEIDLLLGMCCRRGRPRPATGKI